MNPAKMMKTGVLSLAAMLMFPAALLAQSDDMTVAGKITFRKTGDMFVKLLTAAEFEHPKEQAETPPAPLQLKIAIGEAEQQAKSVPFVFQDVPKGRYVVMVFQDENGNGVLDEGKFGPKEAWGMSILKKRPKFRAPKVDEVAFDLTQDVTDMEIEVK